MKAQAYIDAILRAVEQGDADTLASLGQRLSDTEEAMGILRMKGYGQSGADLLATVKLVPAAKFWEK